MLPAVANHAGERILTRSIYSMEITKDLIDRFLVGACTPAEVNVIACALADSKDALNEFVSEIEWEAVAPAMVTDETASNLLLEKLKKELFRKEKPAASYTLTHIKSFAAAAAIVVLIAGAYWLMSQVTQPHPPIAFKGKIDSTPVAHVLKQAGWQKKENTGTKPMVIALEDGSSVTLYKNTVINFQQPFTGNTRQIMLSGDAFFEVAKNELRPFIVTSGNLSTTALGTSFRITVFNQRHEKIRVKLFTGKVVIKSTKQIPGWKQDVFLHPGEEMNYDRRTQLAAVTMFKDANHLQVKDLANLSIHTPAAELSFDGTPLEQVFNQLATMQHTTIHFNTQELHNMNFTGSVSSGDDAATILKLIARMNNLRVVQEGNQFTIEKIKKP